MNRNRRETPAPAKEITGGPWYTDQEFDYEFVKHLSSYVLSYVKEQVCDTCEISRGFVWLRVCFRIDRPPFAKKQFVVVSPCLAVLVTHTVHLGSCPSGISGRGGRNSRRS